MRTDGTVDPPVTRFELPPRGCLVANGPNDPLPYYYHALVGWLYRWRIQDGLALLKPHYAAILELGYGSGVMLPTLSRMSKDVHGVDVHSDPAQVEQRLARLGCTVRLRQGDIAELPYDSARFDLVIAVSLFEHVAEPERALAEIRRVLTPGGDFLVGMPRVDPLMSSLFAAIGFPGIGQHHVRTHHEFLTRARVCFEVARCSHLPRAFGAAGALYYNMLLKPAAKR